MFDNRNTIKFMSDKDVDEFLSRCTSLKYKLGALIMLDCGLRISEMCHLKIKDINWQKKEMYVCSLKKGNNKDGTKKEVWRIAILTDRIVQCAADYFAKYNKKDMRGYVDTANPNAYLFPSLNESAQGRPLSRVQFWRYYDRISDGRVYNHLMRHTFATRSLDAGTDLYTLKELLGHSSIQMTEHYTHVKLNKKHDAAVRLETYTDSPFVRFAKRWFPSFYRIKNVHVLPTQTGWIKVHIGRKDEMILLYSLIEKKVNVLVKGSQGVGKSHILENITGEKIMRIGDTKDFRKTLVGMLLFVIEGEGPEFTTKEVTNADDLILNAGVWEVENKVNNPKEVLLEMLEMKKENIQKASAKVLCDLLIKMTEKGEYTVIIDSVDGITPSVISSLEFLRNHFHFIVAARQVKIEHATWLSNFQKVDIKPLSHSESVELIVRASEDFRQNVEDFELYKTHLLQKCGGNPQFILELIDRFRKEAFVSKHMVHSIDYANGSRKEFSIAPFVFAAVGILVIGRYWSREATPWDREAWMFIAAVLIMLLVFGRGARTHFKRKYI